MSFRVERSGVEESSGLAMVQTRRVWEAAPYKKIRKGRVFRPSLTLYLWKPDADGRALIFPTVQGNLGIVDLGTVLDNRQA